MGPFRSRITCQVPFTLNYSVTAAGSNLYGTAYSLRLNSIYDPEVTPLSLTSPYGYSALAAIYRNYRVWAVDIDVTGSDPSADGVYLACGLFASNQTPNISGQSLTTVAQKQMVDVRPVNNTGSQVVHIRRRISIWDVEGMLKEQWIADPNYAAAFGTNPANYPVLNFAIATVTGTPTLNLTIKLVFTVETYGLIAQ
jgi:hypothetical protein